MVNVLYIHGMGGGGDSRIPSILRPSLAEYDVNLVVRTYSFDPDTAVGQIDSWLEELSPALVIGESLGSLHALRIKGIPHILVSPSLNAPLYFGALAWLTLIPGVTMLFDRIYRPKPGDRQPLHFRYDILRKYPAHRRAALNNSPSAGSTDLFHAFFGTRDHYRKSGVVSVRTWRKHFRNTFETYSGTHFMEEEHVYTRLLPKILNVLNIKK